VSMPTPDAIREEAERIARLRLGADAVAAEITVAAARLGVPYKVLGQRTILAAFKIERADCRALEAIAKAGKYAKGRDQARAIAALEEAAPFFDDAEFLRAHPNVIDEAIKIFQSLPIAAQVQQECLRVARFLSGLRAC